MLDESKQRIQAERHELTKLREELEKERENFNGDVEALKQLGMQVHAESLAVREAMAASQQELAEGRRLVGLAEGEKAAIAEERRLATEKMGQLVEGRKQFELERLDTAKERKVLAHEKVTLSRTAEATRLMQLQLVASMTAPTGPATAAAAAASPPKPPPEGGAEGGGGEGEAAASDSPPRGPTPERVWRQWVKPPARPQPIVSTVPETAPAATYRPPPANLGGIAAGLPASGAGGMSTIAENVVSTDSSTAAATLGGGTTAPDWKAAWQDDYKSAAASLQHQLGFLRALQTQPPLSSTMPPPQSYSAPLPPRVVSSAGPILGRGSGGGTPSEWSPPGCVGTPFAASSTGGSRLSYQWPANVSLGCGASNTSTPSRFYKGAAYAAGQQAASSCWYKGGAASAAGQAAVPGRADGSSSSSMVSLHNVRLSSWGSLPSRSSSSPAHPTSGEGAKPSDAAASEPAVAGEATSGGGE